MLLATTLVIVIPALILSVLLVQQANIVVAKLQSGEAQAMIQRIDFTQYLHVIRRVAPNFDPASLSLEQMLLPAVRQIPGWVAQPGGAVIGGLAGLVLGFALMLLSMYFFYVEGESILQQLTILSPLPKRYDREFIERFKDVIDATFLGQVFTGVAQGIMTGIGLAIAGVPGAVFWGAVAALLSLIPMVGAAAVWVPASIYLAISASMGWHAWWQVIFLVLWGLAARFADRQRRPAVGHAGQGAATGDSAALRGPRRHAGVRLRRPRARSARVLAADVDHRDLQEIVLDSEHPSFRAWIVRGAGKSPTRWWAVQGSNLRPPACKAGALPTELTARGRRTKTGATRARESFVGCRRRDYPARRGRDVNSTASAEGTPRARVILGEARALGPGASL